MAQMTPTIPSTGTRRPNTMMAIASAATMLSMPSATWSAARPKKIRTRGAGPASARQHLIEEAVRDQKQSAASEEQEEPRPQQSRRVQLAARGAVHRHSGPVRREDVADRDRPSWEEQDGEEKARQGEDRVLEPKQEVSDRSP